MAASRRRDSDDDAASPPPRTLSRSRDLPEFPFGDRPRLLAMMRNFMSSSPYHADDSKRLLNEVSILTGSYDGYAKWLTTEELGSLLVFVYNEHNLRDRFESLYPTSQLYTKLTTPEMEIPKTEPLLPTKQQATPLLIQNRHMFDEERIRAGRYLENQHLFNLATEINRVLSASNEADLTSFFQNKQQLISENLLLETRIRMLRYIVTYSLQRDNDYSAEYPSKYYYNGILELIHPVLGTTEVVVWKFSTQREFGSDSRIPTLREGSLLVSLRVKEIESFQGVEKLPYARITNLLFHVHDESFSFFKQLSALLCAYHLHIAPMEVTNKVSFIDYVRPSKNGDDTFEYYSPLLRTWKTLPPVGELLILDWNLRPEEAYNDDRDLYSDVEPSKKSAPSLTHLAYRGTLLHEYDSTMINSAIATTTTTRDALQKVRGRQQLFPNDIMAASSSSGSSSEDDFAEAGLGVAMHLITGALLGPNPSSAPLVARKMFSQWTPEHIASSSKALSCWNQLRDAVSTLPGEAASMTHLSSLPSMTILQPSDEEPLNEYEQEKVKKTILAYLNQVASSCSAAEAEPLGAKATYEAGYQLADALHRVIEPSHVASSLKASSAGAMSQRAKPHYSRELVGVSVRGLKKSLSKTKRQARSSFSKNVLRRTPTDLKRTKALPFKLLSTGDRTFVRDGSVERPKVGAWSKHDGSGYFRMEFRSNAATILSLDSGGGGAVNGVEFQKPIVFKESDSFPLVFFSKRDGNGNRYPLGDLFQFNFPDDGRTLLSNSTGVLLSVQTQFGTVDSANSYSYSEEISATLIPKPSSSRVQIYRVTDTDSLAFIDLHLQPQKNSTSNSSMSRYDFNVVMLRFFFPYKDHLSKINSFI